VPLTDQDVQDLAARNGFNWNGRKPVKGSQEWEWWDFERRKQLGTPHYPFPVVVEYYDPEVAKRVAATRFPFRTRNLHMFVVPIPGSPSLYSAIGIADNNASLADLREFARESLIFKRTEGQSDGIHLGLTKDPNEKNSGQSREAFTRHFTLITYREPDGIEARDIVRQEVVTVTPFFKDNKIVAVEYISDGDLFYADIARIAAQNGLNWTNFEEVPMAQKWIGTIKWNTSIPPHHFQPNPGDAAAGDPIHRLDFLKEFYDPAHNDVHIIVGRLSLSAGSFCVDGVDPMISKGYVIRVENADGKMLLANDPRWIIKSQPSNVRGLVIEGALPRSAPEATPTPVVGFRTATPAPTPLPSPVYGTPAPMPTQVPVQASVPAPVPTATPKRWWMDPVLGGQLHDVQLEYIDAWQKVTHHWQSLPEEQRDQIDDDERRFNAHVRLLTGQMQLKARRDRVKYLQNLFLTRIKKEQEQPTPAPAAMQTVAPTATPAIQAPADQVPQEGHAYKVINGKLVDITTPPTNNSAAPSSPQVDAATVQGLQNELDDIWKSFTDAQRQQLSASKKFLESQFASLPLPEKIHQMQIELSAFRAYRDYLKNIK
jgi:hypothetical protein